MESMPIYDDVTPEAKDMFGDSLMDSKELIKQSHEFMTKIAELCTENDVSAIFLLDKSARPLMQIIKKLFRKYVPNANIGIPNILFINVGQNYIYEKSDRTRLNPPIGFSGDTKHILGIYKKWVKASSTIIVVDEYSNTGASLNHASKIINKAFKADDVKVKSLVAFSKIPKWYQRSDYLGIKEADFEFYTRLAMKKANKELGTNHDTFGELDEHGDPSRDLPNKYRIKVQLLRYEMISMNKSHITGNIPTTAGLGETRTQQEIKDKIPRKSRAARKELNLAVINTLLGE